MSQQVVNLSRGIPLKDRPPETVKQTLSEQDDGVRAPFLALHLYAREHNLGVSTLAGQTGISSTTISQCYNASYPGDYSEVSKRIQKFFWRLEQKKLYGNLDEFVETQLSQTLFAIFDKTRIIRRIQLVTGPEQVGKTRTAREYAERNNSGRTVFLSLPGGTKSGAQDFIWSLAAALDIPYTIKLREKRIRIRSALEVCDLLIIDEAHLCFSWTDRSLAEFWDYLRTDIHANGERGVVLMATNTDMLAGIQRFRKRAGYNIGQLLGRMRNDPFIVDPAEDIVRDDVRLLVERYYKPGRSALDKLVAAATRTNLGHYNLVLDAMTEAWTLAKSRKKELTDELVESTLQRSLDTLGKHKELYE